MLDSYKLQLLIEFSRFHTVRLIKALLPERGTVVSGERALAPAALVSERSLRAAGRIRAELAKADAGSYGTHGWASYLSRADVEALVEAVEAMLS